MDPFDLQHPFLIGHRGHREKAPENTLAAFQAAVEAGLPMLELDVQLSLDRRLIVIHDDELDRTTNGQGPVGRLPLAALQALDAGSWYGPEFASQKLPTLEEVLDLVGGKILLNIEIKPNAYEEEEPEDDCLSQAYHLVRERELLEQVLFSSFQPKVLLALRKKEIPPRIGFLTEMPLNELHLQAMEEVGATYWNQQEDLIRPEDIPLIRERGLECLSYTVNDPKRMQELAEMGVAGFFTDRPSLLAQALNAKSP